MLVSPTKLTIDPRSTLLKTHHQTLSTMSKLAYLPFTLSARLTPSLSIPLIGFGTWELNSSTTPPGTCKNAVLEAIKSGIRHIDTAPSYGTDKEVGEALRECGVPREQLFVTSKLYQTFHRREDVPRALDRALEGLGLGYVDLFLLHCEDRMISMKVYIDVHSSPRLCARAQL